MSNTTKTILIIGSLLSFLAIVLWGLGDALGPLVVSFGSAYLVFPFIKKLEQKGVNRNHAVMGVFTTFLIVFVALMALVIPKLILDAREFMQELPANTTRAIEKIETVGSKLGYEINLSQEGIKGYIEEHTSELSGGMVKSLSRGLFVAFSGVTKWLLAILNLFLIPLFFFYVINDYEKISSGIKSFVPMSLQPKLSHYLSLGNRVLSGYIWGQLMVALVLACLYALGLTVVGLRFGALIGIAAGLLSVIPYAGFTIGFGTALLMGFANHGGVALIIGIVAVFVVIQILESIIVTPRLVGNKVGLSAFATMLALIIGGNLAGLPGMLIAVPTAAIMKSVLADLKNEYRQLEIFKAP